MFFPSFAPAQHRAVDGSEQCEAAARVRERQVWRLPGARAHLLLQETPQPLPGVRPRERGTFTWVSTIDELSIFRNSIVRINFVQC